MTDTGKRRYSKRKVNDTTLLNQNQKHEKQTGDGTSPKGEKSKVEKNDELAKLKSLVDALLKRDKEKNLLIERLSLQLKEIFEGKKEIKKRVEDLESKITELSVKSASDSGKAGALVSSYDNPSRILWSMIVAPRSNESTSKTKKSEPKIAVLNTVFSEQLDRENRKRNVIVFGLETSNANND